jgi:pSer/pThr/pTyr-binding forkhead associated (FHA) protein
MQAIPLASKQEIETEPLANSNPVDIPDLVAPDPLVMPEPLVENIQPRASAPLNANNQPISRSNEEFQPETSSSIGDQSIPSATMPASAPASSSSSPATSPATASAGSPKTQLQQQVVSLLHMQTNTSIELPQNLTVIHLGKPNDRIPPDVDVAGFPNSEVVSRIHADIRIEGGAFFIEDVGSANGTYVNNISLPPGNRHRLRAGDRIALGKGDLVTFLFQLS